MLLFEHSCKFRISIYENELVMENISDHEYVVDDVWINTRINKKDISGDYRLAEDNIIVSIRDGMLLCSKLSLKRNQIMKFKRCGRHSALSQMIAYTHRGSKFYNYNTFCVENQGKTECFSGYRDVDSRLDMFQHVNLKNKSVLDVGCNTGVIIYKAMVQFGATRGIGIDVSPQLINAATMLCKDLNAHFYTFDLTKDSLLLLPSIAGNMVDVACILAVSRWASNWKEIVLALKDIAETIVYESNGTVEELKQQDHFLRENFTHVKPHNNNPNINTDVRRVYTLS
jgi:SAM-dependent methyltransferase